MPPVIGEGEDDRAGQTAAKRALDLPFQHLRLAGLAFAQRVDAEFAQQKRLGFGEHLQAREVILKRLPLVQIDVETKEIHALRAQKFGGRKIGEGAQAFRVRPLGCVNEIIDEIGDRLRAAPAHDVRWNLVGDAEGENGRMSRAGEHGSAHRLASFGALGGRVEETEMLVPGNVDEHLQLVLGGQVEKPLGGDVIDADEVRPEFADLGKVAGGLFRRGERLAGGIRREWAIRQALGVEFLFAEPEEFAIHAHTWRRGSRDCHAL